jgi:hypothetical protein
MTSWCIPSREEEHEYHLKMVLQVLREHLLYAKLSKCLFYQKKIHYLGHIISKDGIVVDPEKIEAIREWSTPNNVTEVRSFMGLAGYYKKVHHRVLKDSSPHHFFVK